MRIIVTAMLVLGCVTAHIAFGMQQIFLTDADAEWIGNKIFFNECSGKDKFLISWNKGEDFMSLGIGHFIWYSEGRRGPFDETFPALINFIKDDGRIVPDWLQGPKVAPCPWQSREEFLLDLNSSQVHDLKKLLMGTKDLQSVFIINRLKDSLPKILKYAPEDRRAHIEQQFNALASTPSGLFALIDYVNFKGEGILATERYKGQGWGLLQVLDRMDGIGNGMSAVDKFVQTAAEILTERVNNSPPERGEQRWLRGWKARINAYLNPGIGQSV